MAKFKRIVLVTSASNFEKQKSMIHSLHARLKEVGGYVLYVVSSYGLLNENNPYDKGAASIYGILERIEFDACLMEGNIGNSKLLYELAEMLKRRNIPFLTVAIGLEGIPFVLLESYDACRKIMVHLIEEHHCKRINLISRGDGDMFSYHAGKAFRDVVEEYGINEGKDCVIEMPVSLKDMGQALELFREKGIENPDAILCVHEVFAIGLCEVFKEKGINVPEDVLLCTLNRSANSVVYRPDIAGVTRMDRTIIRRACELIQNSFNGKEIPFENYIEGELCVGESCGCIVRQNKNTYEQNCDIIISKIEAAKQIGSMMDFNASLDETDSLEELGDSLKNMMERIGIKEFICNLNQYAIDFVNMRVDESCEQAEYFDEEMTVLIGNTERSGLIRNVKFPTTQVLPVEEREGDLYLLFPIHYREKVFGYLTFINEYMPIDMYNYRICHESIGSSMENLYRQMVLRKKIEELDQLHMKDALTGLYNRFALERFKEDYIQAQEFCIVSMDMDGLKKINDTVGHLAGNHAICIVANAIKESALQTDLVTRCGGDEFQIVSHNVDATYWENVKITINERIAEQLVQQHLPYETSVSMGYCICTKDNPIEFMECYALADQRMYEDKKERKAKR